MQDWAVMAFGKVGASQHYSSNFTDWLSEIVKLNPPSLSEWVIFLAGKVPFWH